MVLSPPRRMTPIRGYWLPAALFALLFLLLNGLRPATPARAAFPGVNGQIAFASNRDGDDEIFVMNPDGTGQTQLIHNTAAEFHPAWSPAVPPPR